ncbi:nicotinamide riboside transporter PnuC [Runella slithyformis]|uniref:Nicotinamide riboside transporter PnuC n=1 Tax=Runella slithyformis (strain ATCC 29530 / DSM 19594 / LMG 11500 / NCIMB 11436 / LSU 4) TaxID=761193 RepID=A0A7U4E5C0_RUNSL|nr:nicotinamide riboside transporter PnuC [Runella slithyformis]AEI48416.1 nicotinamide mononucleotide transporter PnuC [Runella slithyformis DSM 19594]
MNRLIMNFFDINSILFEAWGYKMSHLEFWATVTGAVAVWLSARENVWSWIIGLLNVVLAFVLFYQIRLYPDMFLQVFFFITNLIGWWQWKYPKANEANLKNELIISKLTLKQWLVLGAGGLVCTFAMGGFAKNLHEFFPVLFSQPSAFPYMDSFTTVMSIVATFMLIRKKIEAWYVWLVVDAIATYMYYLKEVKLYALLYFLFCFIAAFGAYHWTKEYRSYVKR